MKLAELKKLVKKGESEQLEFKSSTGGLSDGMQTICAFLNSDKGGTVIFGVSDGGKIIGQQVNDKTLKKIGDELSKIETSEDIDAEYIPVGNGKEVIVFHVEAGKKAPYLYDGRGYIRRGSTTKRMTKEEHAYLYNKQNYMLWETLLHNSCTLKDLDINRIKEVIRKALTEKRISKDAATATIPSVLKKLHLMKGDKLTNAAVILFCKNENKQFAQSTIKLARFRGTTKSEFINAKEYTSNAFDLYDKADDFLSAYIPVAAHIESGKADRVETPAIPYSVLREALANALVHRDYSNPGGSVSVAIYDDRVAISNIGSLPADVTLKELTKEHDSVPRNPLIANAFYLDLKIEKWGRGTTDMIRDSKKAGNPVPKFENEGNRFSVTLPFKKSIRTVIYEEDKKADLSMLTGRQKEIMRILKNGPLNRLQIMETLGLDLTPRAMQWELSKLKTMGLIKLEGKAQAAVWRLVDQK